MKVAELLETRRRNWQELETLCSEMKARRKSTMGAPRLSRFAALYRAAAADLALADAYRLPPNTVHYLHRLVGRAHNQLYRSRRFNFTNWGNILLFEVPQRIFNDRCVQIMFVLFWGTFILSGVLAYNEQVWPGYAQDLLGDAGIEQLDQSFSQAPRGDDRNTAAMMGMAAFYINHNTTIGLQCFAGGLLVVPGIYITLFNAANLGAAFGFMAGSKNAGNFYEFVAAHGPFELTAIVLAAGSGLRLGVSVIITRGFTRAGSLAKTAKEAMPLMGASMVLFFLAALIEGFISPSPLPMFVKLAVCVVCSLLLFIYFVLLGFPRSLLGAA